MSAVFSTSLFPILYFVLVEIPSFLHLCNLHGTSFTTKVPYAERQPFKFFQNLLLSEMQIAIST